MTRGTLLITLFLIFSLNVFSQKCSNPGVRLDRLKKIKVTIDTLRNWAKRDLSFLNLSAHDTVADIGSYDGYYPILYAALVDNPFFYVNDIDSAGFVFTDSIRIVCEAIIGRTLEKRLKIVLGDSINTKLPRMHFNKVIAKDALHHFKAQNKMLADIKSIMKPDGKLFLYEPLRTSSNQDLCKGAMTKGNLLKLMSVNGFKLAKIENSKGPETWFEFNIK